MCGITGFIGRSKDSNLSFNLLTKLFEKSESRGVDAAGFWATEMGINASVAYHKEPIRSSRFVKSETWKKLSRLKTDLVIAHARGASKGVGEPFFNENNHPFTSQDKTIALVHNGRIEDEEYYELRKSYEVNTNCDSEILLRIFEAKTSIDKLEPEVNAIKDIFGLINEGHMAAAIGKRMQHGSRKLWLFRNEYRPLWISDLREELGLVFFVSEPSIWEEAYAACDIKNFSNCQKLIEIYPNEIWELNLENNDEIISKRYAVEKENIIIQNNEFYHNILENKPYFNLITKLDEKDQIIRETNPDIWNEFELKEVEECCIRITEKIKSLRLDLKNRCSEGTIEKELFNKILFKLKKEEENVTEILSILYN